MRVQDRTRLLIHPNSKSIAAELESRHDFAGHQRSIAACRREVPAADYIQRFLVQNSPKLGVRIEPCQGRAIGAQIGAQVDRNLALAATMARRWQTSTKGPINVGTRLMGNHVIG